MKIDNELVDRLAHLSRLEFQDAEKEEIRTGLEEMIGFVDKLNQLDTSGVEPLLHITDNKNILRPDIAEQTLQVSDAVKNSAFPEAKYFKVPKVINK
jgi:aspartyl-tRNA(Asn)/glutamyl-tRNA(Gln) amidotransferase subunit C